MSKQIELRNRKGHPSQYAIVDDCDYEQLIERFWYCADGRAVRGNPRIFMHREIVNAPDGMEVDHINGNQLDNRRCNLRICTHAQNTRNRKPHGSLPRFKGVKAVDRRWCAQIMVNGIETYLGRFDSAVAAARAYDAAARRLHGEYARLNFPD